MEKTDTATIVLLVFFILVVPMTGCLNDPPTEPKIDNDRSIGTIDVDSIGDISCSWNTVQNKYYIVGGQDLFGGDDQTHNRFIYTANGTQIEKLQFIDDPRRDIYLRYTSIACHPFEDWAFITGINGTLSKFFNGSLELVYNSTSHRVGKVTWAPDGEYALIGGQDFIIKYLEGHFEELETDGHGLIDASWSADGDYVLLADCDEGEIGKYDGKNFATLKIGNSLNDYIVQHVSCSPKGEIALIGMQRSDINGPYQALVSYDGSDFHLVKDEIGEFPTVIVWDQDGNYAVTGDLDLIYEEGTVKDLDLGVEGTIVGGCSGERGLLILQNDERNSTFNLRMIDLD